AAAGVTADLALADLEARVAEPAPGRADLADVADAAAADVTTDVANVAAAAAEAATRKAAGVSGGRGCNGGDADRRNGRQGEQGSLGLAEHVSLLRGGVGCLPFRRRRCEVRSKCTKTTFVQEIMRKNRRTA